MSPILIWRNRLTEQSYAPSTSLQDNTRSIKGRMPSSLEMARDSSSRAMAFARTASLVRSSKAWA